MPQVNTQATISGSKKSEVSKRFNSLIAEKANWDPSWKDLKTYINPVRGIFDGMPNRGQMIDHQTLLDSHATHSVRVLASGMSSGMTSPSRPWFRLTLDNAELAKLQPVRVWLDEVRLRMLDVCSNSNIYDVFYSMYEELGTFGTAAAVVLEDFDDVIRARNYTIGEYALGTDHRGRVNAFAREFNITVSQCVEMFGYEKCPIDVKTSYDQNKMDEWVKVSNLIEPNKKRDMEMEDNTNMAYKSYYWKSGDGSDDYLAETGFLEFPVIAPRWDQITTDMIYGYGPGWFALGGVKQLQKTVLDKLLMQEKIHNPPIQTDATVGEDAYVNLLPGGVTRTSGVTPNSGVRASYEVKAQLESILEAINGLKQSIDKDFFVNIFLMMINFDKTNMTATEVAQREQENLMMMGPLLIRVNHEMLDPYLERLFGIMERNGLLPPPPEEIMGLPVKVEYVSILAQAQKAIGVQSINRVIGFIGETMGIKPDLADVIDLDQTTREVAEMEGVPAKLMVPPEVVAQIREQRAKALQMQQAAEMANSAADTTKKLADSKMDENTALDGVLEGIKGR